MKTKHKPITVTLNASKLPDALTEIWAFLMDNPEYKIKSLHLKSFYLPGKKKRWRMKFTEED